MSKIPTVYLCGPIAACNDSEAKDWRNYVKNKGLFICLDPIRRDYRNFDEAIGNNVMTWQIAKEIVEYDKIDIMQSDVVLANLNPKKSSVGTHQEIIYAWERGKLVVLVAPKNHIISPWLMYHSQQICYSLDDAIDYIVKIFK